MCVIIASQNKNKRPSLETLRACEAQNPHGGGVAYIENGQVYFRKGLKSGEIHKLFKNVRGPMVAHFRWATVGGINDRLCHPFIVSRTSPVALDGYAKAALFHNGTWTSRDKQMAEAGIPSKLKGLVSDSRQAATMVHAAGVGALAEMEGRYCLITKDGFKLHNDGWTRHNGIWFSNMRWHISRPVVALYKTTRRAPTKQGRRRRATTREDILGSSQSTFELLMDQENGTNSRNWPD